MAKEISWPEPNANTWKRTLELHSLEGKVLLLGPYSWYNFNTTNGKLSLRNSGGYHNLSKNQLIEGHEDYCVIIGEYEGKKPYIQGSYDILDGKSGEVTFVEDRHYHL